MLGSDFNKHDDADASRNNEYKLRGAAALSFGLFDKLTVNVGHRQQKKILTYLKSY
jgi:hypothetical protein